jgi:hypothetical protein
MALPGTKPRFTAEQRTALQAWYQSIPVGRRKIELELKAARIGCSYSVLKRCCGRTHHWKNHREAA